MAKAPSSQTNPPSAATLLAAEGVFVGYGTTDVLADLDLTLPPNRISVLVGPNGCGKSTLLRTLARLLAPRQGRVSLDGEDIRHRKSRDVARELGILVQNPVTPEGITVRELVAQGRYAYRRPWQRWSEADEQALTLALEATDTSDLAGRQLAGLSGGQRQRCWLAMALAQEPSILLLDEPTTFLDVAHQLDLLERLRQLNQKQGQTIGMVLHDLNHAAWYADHIILMKAGEIVAQGGPQEVLTVEAIQQVFGVSASLLTDPATGRLVCVPRLSGVHG